MDTEYNYADEVSDQKKRRANRFKSKRRFDADDSSGGPYINGTNNLDPRIGTMLDSNYNTVYYCFNGPDIIKGTRSEIEAFLGV